MRLNQHLLELLQEIQEIPSSPFLSKPSKEYIISLLTKYNVPFSFNHYSIIARPVQNPGATKLVFLTHTDHPGAVLKNNRIGILFGSVGLGRLGKQLPIPMKVFSPQGKYLGKGEITHIEKSRKIGTKIDFDVPKNSFAQYDFPYLKNTPTHIKLYNADNGIDTAVMLHLLSKRIESGFDLYFVFNFHEEVHQISAWHLSRHNPINIGSRDIVINLEAPIIENQKNKFCPPVNYENGPVLELSNLNMVHGYKNPGKNLAEVLLKTTAHRYKLDLQIGATKGSDEARAITNFGLTPNIVTLAIPNRYKHNRGSDGQVVPEEILKKDVVIFSKLLSKAILFDPKKLNKISTKMTNLSLQIKKNDCITDKDVQLQKAKLNDRLDVYYKAIIKRGYYFPESLKDSFQDFALKLLFYFMFLIQKLY
ncbi:hypothetical protein KJ953_01005 [Patescibacteria group bacterium]|nr:hypothetical protein [Patescibacteria group bacterium]MBU1256497.1 hypothetical protein [Patescibacteria group bacterium]MBU1457820.1 hypothetical protein [Patescibacteria group bacterium]